LIFDAVTPAIHESVAVNNDVTQSAQPHQTGFKTEAEMPQLVPVPRRTAGTWKSKGMKVPPVQWSMRKRRRAEKWISPCSV
jgi:hypothetical protein